MALENIDGSIIIDTKVDQSELDHSLNSMQSTVAKASVAMVAAIGSALGAISAMVIDVGSEYETSLAKASTLFGDTEVDTKNLTSEILELSSATGESATALNEGLYQAMSAGVEVTEDMTKATGFLDQAVKLAKGGFTETSTSVDIMTTTLNAYGEAAGDAQNVSDMLITTQNLGKTTVNELAASMGRVIPTAAAYKVSLANLNTTYAVMTASGIATAEATTYMRSMFSELADTTSDVATILQNKTGKSFAQLNEEGYSLAEILDILKDSVDGDTTAFANLWSSQEAGTGALAVVNNGVEEFNSTLNKMETSAGATEVAYGKMSETFEVKGQRMQSALSNIGIQAYDKFQEPLSEAFDTALKTLNDFSVELYRGDLDEGLDTLAESIGGILENAVSLAAKGIPVLVNGFASLADRSDELIVLTAAVSAALVTYNMVQKESAAVTLLSTTYKKAAAVADIAYSSAMAVATGQMGILEAAQLALNTVMMANPVGLVVAGIVGLTAGLAALTLVMGDNISETKAQTLAMQEKAAAFKEVQDAADAAQEANVAEINNLQAMKNELDNLLDSNGNVIEGFEARANYLVNELAQATGSDIELVDGQIENYNTLSDAIDESIEKMRAEAIMSANTEEYQEAIKNQGEALKDLQQATKEYNEYAEAGLADLAEAEEEYRLAKDSGDLIRIENARKNLADETALHAEHKAALDQAQGNYDAYTKTITDYEQAKTLTLQGEYDKVADVYSASTDALYTSVDDKKQALKDELDAEILNIQSLERQRTDANSDTIDAQKKAGEDRIAEIKKELNGLTQAVEDETPDYEKANADMAQAGLDGYNDQADVYTWNQVGKDSIQGVIDGADSKNGSLWAKMSSMASSALASFKKTLGIASPSRAFRSLASWIVPGIVGGVEENEELATKKMSNLAYNMANSFDADVVANAVDKVQSNISGAQAKLANAATIQSSYQVSNSVNNLVNANRQLKGSINGTITVITNIDGREAAVTLAPMVSEEIKFNEE